MTRGCVRLPALLRLANGQRCQNCGRQDGTVVAAHANWSDFGKGKSVKAHDFFSAWLCHPCHAWLDQGTGRDPTGMWDDSREEKRGMWRRAFERTLVELWSGGHLEVR